MPDDEKLRAVRAALPAVGAGIYLDAGAAGPLPAEVAKAMADLEQWELTVGRASRDYGVETRARVDEARASVAAIVGSDTGSIALSHGTTDAAAVVTRAVDWRPGDRIVTTGHEHAGALAVLAQVRDRLGVELVVVDVPTGGDDERTIDAFEAAIVPGTRLVWLSHVLATTGAMLPVGRVAELARSVGATVVVDAAQSVGAVPVDVEAFGADFVAISAHTWLLGPEGIGALWVAPGVLERELGPFDFHRPSVVGLARACGWLSMYVGLAWVQRRGADLARRARARLASIPGVDVVTPADRMAGLVTFRIGGWGADAALDELGRRVFAIAGSVPAIDAIRISVGFWNTEDEVDRFADAVALLAAHSPETLPPRPRLTVLGSDG